MSEALHLTCPHCGTTNRVPEERLDEAPKCGKCKQPLFTGHPLELNAQSFDRYIAGDLPVVVDFWAPWCGPCRSMAPHFERAAAELEPKVRLAKLNTEAEQTIAARLGIRSIPTMIAFKNGKEVARQSGAMDSATVVRWVRSQV
jgi:thioredoxin 2